VFIGLRLLLKRRLTNVPSPHRTTELPVLIESQMWNLSMPARPADAKQMRCYQHVDGHRVAAAFLIYCLEHYMMSPCGAAMLKQLVNLD
jgi:hypothetical protein